MKKLISLSDWIGKVGHGSILCQNWAFEEVLLKPNTTCVL